MSHPGETLERQNIFRTLFEHLKIEPDPSINGKILDYLEQFPGTEIPDKRKVRSDLEELREKVTNKSIWDRLTILIQKMDERIAKEDKRE